MYQPDPAQPEAGQPEDPSGEAAVLAPPAAETEEKQSAPGAAAMLGEIAQTVVLALILFLIIRNFIQNYRVENISMEPNLHEGQFLIINRFAYCPGLHLDLPIVNAHVEKTWCVRQPRRGDVVVFHYPPDPTKDFIKRVIGLPGETVEMQDGQVYINGKQMAQPFGPNPTTTSSPPVTLGPNELFVMGDNRPSSSDSRVWGPLPLKDVVGRAVVRYWPPNKWSLIPHWDFPELASQSETGQQ